MGMGSFYHFFPAMLGISACAGVGNPVTFLPMNTSHAPAACPSEALSKRVLAVLAPGPRPPDALWADLEKAFGNIDFKGDFHAFAHTEYYRSEFGDGLHRGFISFRGLMDPSGLAPFKRETAALEAAWVRGGRRSVNLDAGYLDPDKLVLASLKRGPGKLYLRDGVYADFLLRYDNGGFEPLPWAFPDFQDGRYHKSLLAIREKMKSEMRLGRGTP